MIRVGQGFDVHQLVSGRRLILGGVSIPYELGLAGHSDADVLIHALCDALLGAAGRGDIGQHFPDTDERFRDADSRDLLRHVTHLVTQDGWSVANADLTIIAQAPRLAPFLPEMRKRLAADLQVDAGQLNIKATTTEKLGFCGRGEGVAAMAVVLLQKAPGYGASI